MKSTETLLIIGATSDIAVSAAHQYASNGYNLQLAARNKDDLDSTITDLAIRYRVDVSAFQLDILDYQSFKKFIDSLTPLPDVILCAVGLLGDQAHAQKDIFESTKIMRTNFEGPSLFLNEIANKFEERGTGIIIGVSSVAGERGRSSNYIYGSGKAGFTAFLSGLRNRLSKSGINVITVIPGYIDTRMTKGLNLPSILTSSPKILTYKIFRKMSHSVIYCSRRWYVIMLLIRLIPESIFKKLNI
jgi:decaprenylphospho-beta-D-erythro-pentofuranosid-2-ulose 2-reductase